MELKRRRTAIYALLFGVWLLLTGWQEAEHLHVREQARLALVNRGADISTTLGIVLRSQRHFGGLIPEENLTNSLAQLVSQGSGELSGIALLNNAGEVVASA